MKTCSKCNINQEFIFFQKDPSKKDGYCGHCKNCKKEYRENNKEEIKESQAKWRENNKEYEKLRSSIWRESNRELIRKKDMDKYYSDPGKSKENHRKYLMNNKEKNNIYYRKYRKEYIKNRKESDPTFKLSILVSDLIRSSIKKQGYKKELKSSKILGCSTIEFRLYIENKFEPWMNWNNHGIYNGELNQGWDIDHIIPLSSAKTQEEVIKLNHYTNLQPLCSKTNRYIKKDIIWES